MEDTSDTDLVRRTLAGERDAFEVLVTRYWERLYVLVAHTNLSSVGPEDIVQEAFIQAYRKLAFLRNPACFGSWLYKIVLRICGKHRSKLSAGVAASAEVAFVPVDLDKGLLAKSEASETRERVREAVASLPHHYRLVVVLRFFDDMTCEQVAEHLGEPVGTVWARLHRASKLLREKLGCLAPEVRR